MEFAKTMNDGFELPEAFPDAKRKSTKVPHFACKFALYDLAKPFECEELEEVMTDIYNTEINPDYKQKKWLQWEKTFFSDGSPLVAVKYVEEAAPPPPPESKAEPISDDPETLEIKGRRRERKALLNRDQD